MNVDAGAYCDATSTPIADVCFPFVATVVSMNQDLSVSGKTPSYMSLSMKSDQEQAMRALQQRVQKSVNCEMVLMNSKWYDPKLNGKVKKAIREAEGHVRNLKLHTEDRIGKTIPPTIRSSTGW